MASAVLERAIYVIPDSLENFFFDLKIPLSISSQPQCVCERGKERGGGERERERKQTESRWKDSSLHTQGAFLHVWICVYVFNVFFLVRNLTEEIINHKEEIVKYMVLILP